MIWPAAFLAAFRETGNVRLACEAAGIDRSTPYEYRQTRPEFAAEWAAAREDAADMLVREARRRAVEGVRRLKFHEGVPVLVPAAGPDGLPVFDKKGHQVYVPYVEHEYSDTLLIFLLKGARPEEYRENHKHVHTGAVAQVHVYLPRKDDPPGPGT